MFLPPRMQRLPTQWERISKAPELTFIFKDLLAEHFSSLLHFSLRALPITERLSVLLYYPTFPLWCVCGRN